MPFLPNLSDPTFDAPIPIPHPTLPMLFLSHLAESDAPRLRDMCQDSQVHRNTLRLPNPYTLADAEYYIRESRDRRQRVVDAHEQSPDGHVGGIDGARFCIRDGDGHKGLLIGSVGLWKVNAEQCGGAMGELGYYLHADYRGRGIMPIVVGILLEIAFSPLMGLERVQAAPFAFNEGSGRVLEKAGFKFEGRLRSFYLKDGQFVDGLMYAVVRRDFDERKQEA